MAQFSRKQRFCSSRSSLGSFECVEVSLCRDACLASTHTSIDIRGLELQVLDKEPEFDEGNVLQVHFHEGNY